jgi:hypothetical protein
VAICAWPWLFVLFGKKIFKKLILELILMFKKALCHQIPNYPCQACEGLSIHIKKSFNCLKKIPLICKNQNVTIKYNY